MVTSWWIGRSGDLRELHSDGLSVSRKPDRRATVHALLSGRSRVDRALRTSRSWAMSWQWAQRADWSRLYELYDGQGGPGPFWLLDPTVGNYLSPDQATAGTAVGDSVAWATLTAAETVTVSSAFADLGCTTSVLWDLPVSPTQGVLRLPHYSGLHRPTLPGWEWTYWQRLGNWSSDLTIDARVELVWYDDAGFVLSTSTGTYAPLTVTNYSRLSVTGVAPADAVGVEPRVRVDLADIGAGVSAEIRLGRARLIQGPDDATWYPGQDIPRVSITDQDDALPHADYTTTSWALTEVI